MEFENAPREHAKIVATFGPGTGIETEFQQEGQLLDERAAYGEDTPRGPKGAARHRRST